MMIKIKVITMLFLILVIGSLSVRATNHLSGSKPYSDMNQEERREYLSSLGFNVFNEKNSNGVTPDDIEISNDGVVVAITKNGNTKSQKNPIDLSNLNGERTIKLSEGGKLKDKSGNQYNFEKGSDDIKVVSGQIIIKNAILRKGSLIDGNQVQGTIESYDSKTKTLISQRGKSIVFNGVEYSPYYSSNVRITPGSDSFSVFGKSVVAKSSNKMLFEFSVDEGFKKSADGQVTLYKDGHITIGQGTKYIEYDNNQKSAEYSISKDTDLYAENGKCKISSNCIEKDKSGELKIFTSGENNIRVKAFDDSIKHIWVNEITDASKVTFIKNGVDITYSKDPILIKGNPLLIGLSFSTIFKGNEYNFDYYQPIRTEKKISEQQFLNDINYLLDQGYSIYDIARGVYHRDWYTNKFGGTKGDHALLVWDGPEGSKYLELQDQLKNLLPPYVDIDGKTVQINHAFAGIVTSANTPRIIAPFKTFMFTTYGDNMQLISGKIHAVKGYYGALIIGTPLSLISENSRRGVEYHNKEWYEWKWKDAESFYPESQYRGNVIGRQIASQVRDKSNQDITNLFKQEFEKIKKEQKK